jgi:hypothetical protein
MPDTSGKIRTNPAIVSFPTLLEARATNKKQPNDKKYSVTLIFKKGEGVENLKKAVEDLIAAKWPKGTKRPKLKLPFRDGKDYEEKEGYEEGDIFLQFARKESFGEPNDKDGFPVVGPQKDKATGKFKHLTKKDIYPGMIGVVITKPYYWHNDEAQIKDGISFGLEGFQKVKEGERLGGHDPVTAEDEFEEFEVETVEGEENDTAPDSDDVDFETEE